MARYYRRRYTRVVKPKKKWATNIVDVVAGSGSNGNKCFFQGILCQNSAGSANPTPVILKTGNFKLQCDAFFTLSNGSAVEFSVYVMYMPEGTILTDYDSIKAFVDRHPEWILAWKYGSFDQITGTSNIETIRVSSRLKRNLNSGDSIMLFGLGVTGTGITFTNKGMAGRCQFWTCAN